MAKSKQDTVKALKSFGCSTDVSKLIADYTPVPLDPEWPENPDYRSKMVRDETYELLADVKTYHECKTFVERDNWSRYNTFTEIKYMRMKAAGRLPVRGQSIEQWYKQVSDDYFYG